MTYRAVSYRQAIVLVLHAYGPRSFFDSDSVSDIGIVIDFQLCLSLNVDWK